MSGPPPRLLLFGAVDLAIALSRVARAVGWRAFVIDPRAERATPGRFPDAERVVVTPAERAVADLGGLDRDTAVAALAHEPELDDPALLLALASDAGYVGAMGGRGSQAKRRERLLVAGASETQLERLAAPIGLDLGGRSEPEMALSIMAEIVAVRHGREGGRLAHGSGPVRGAPA